MESEKSALKQSFFREYFFYKLRGTLGICIASAVMGLITCALSSFVVYTVAKQIEREYTSGGYSYSNFYITTLIAGIVGMVIIAIVAPIISFKYYRHRASMDTLGCLPITYGQRFWGDFLSGLAAIVVPFSVMAAVGGIFLMLTQPIIDSVKPVHNLAAAMDGADKSLLLFGMKMYLIVLIMIVATYSITTLVTSCCGKVGSSALYSDIALPIIPAVIGLYGTFVLNLTKGILPEQKINTLLSCFPPIGTFLYLINGVNGANISAYYDNDSDFSVIPNAATVIVSLLFIAAMIVGAYFIGKRRKTERVGNGFAVSAMYHILTLLLVLAIIGVYFSANKILGLDVTKILIGVVITLVFYLILEFVQYRNFKKIGMSLVRYACVAAAGFGFLIIAMNTYGFGMGSRLPNQDDIAEITVKSREFGNSGGGEGTIKYRADEAISVILAENQRLADHPDDIITGDYYVSDSGINFIYELKNGDTVSRYYTVHNNELFEEVVEKIKKQPAYEIELLGVLNRDDFTGMKMSFTPFDESGEPQNDARVQVKDSKIPELVERLKYDLINHVQSDDEKFDFGILAATLPEGEEDKSIMDDYYKTRFFIEKSYTRTIEFLNDPDNFFEKKTDDPNDPANGAKTYRVEYSTNVIDDGTSSPMVTHVEVRFRSDSDSEYAKELMSYFVSGTDYESVTNINAYMSDVENGYNLGELFHVPADKHQAALKAMLNLIAEQNGSIQ